MATEKKLFKQAPKRSVSGSPTEPEQITHHMLQTVIDWSNDHDFISPNEIYVNAIGLPFCLITKRLINISFTNLYHRSLKITWADLLNRERKLLKSNMNSVEKCFIMNRLITEYTKEPYKFARQTAELYEEIKMRMSSKVPNQWTADDLYGQIRTWRNLQYQRRLFHISHDEANHPLSLLSLQRMVTTLFSQFLLSYQINPIQENYNNLKQLLQHAFIIVTQPSIPECVAAAKYEKLGSTQIAKLYARVVCLLDPDIIEKHSKLFNINVTLYPFDHTVDPSGEEQAQLEWHKRPVVDAEETLRNFFYFELESIELKKLDNRNSRPLYSTKLCHLQFQFQILINQFNINEDITLISQPFGLCSHAQYYPEHIAQVILYEVAQMPQSHGAMIQPNILTNYVYRYFTRISGVETKSHTCQYIADVLKSVYEQRRTIPNLTPSDIYEDILAKLISQMEMFIDHPFLSMMYHDGLFLGICNSNLDQQLHGTREQPHMLLRFNSLLTHQSLQNPSVRFIVHNGQLIRATFHTKAFVDEMCRMICEANVSEAKKMQFLYQIPSRNFHDFSMYFDTELYRLNTAASPIKDAYKPLIPVLWNTMKTNTEEQVKEESHSPTLPKEELMPVDFSTSSRNQIQINLSDVTSVSNPSKTTTITNEKVIIQTDMLIHHVVEKLTDLLEKSSRENVSSTSVDISKASTLLSTLTEGNIQQQKQLLSHILQDYFQSKTNIEVATQTSPNSSPNMTENT